MPKTESLSRPAFAEIHLDRLTSNLRYLQGKTTHPFFCPMLKANAYGHGDQQIANLLQKENINTVGVSTIDEAIHLRHGGFNKDILVFSPSFQSCLSEVINFNLTPVLSEASHIEAFKKNKSTINIHIKLNTGMNRMGLDEDTVEDTLSSCQKYGLQVIGTLTHLHSSSDISNVDGFSHKQIRKYEELHQKYFSDSIIKHVYNSDGLLNAGKATYGARPGIALYGYSDPYNENLLPVMELKAKLVSVRRVSKNEVVSYGGTWRAEKDTTIGVLPLGYADGVSRNLSNNIHFRYEGKQLPQIGNICMDYTMVDLESVKDKIKVGSVVSLFGKDAGYTAADVAKKIHTIPYEVLTSVSERIPRFFID
ncbi:MAG: alanine racemase [Bdellovibrionales bacterium]|nr:alanine racemase [Bdellovibrionales bacterium]